MILERVCGFRRVAPLNRIYWYWKRNFKSVRWLRAVRRFCDFGLLTRHFLKVEENFSI